MHHNAAIGKTQLIQGKEVGAEDRDRTGDLTITNRLLYQLSYLGSWMNSL